MPNPVVFSTDKRTPRKSEQVGARLNKLMENTSPIDSALGVQPLSQGFFLHQHLRKNEHPKERGEVTKKLKES